MNKLIVMFFLSPALLWGAEDVFYINGEAVKAISLSLQVNSIDFGDVFSDSEVDSEMVGFTVNAENSYDYTVEISNDDNTDVVQLSRTVSGVYAPNSIAYTETATGADQLHEFYVDLNTASMSSDLSATITVMVVYNDVPE